MTATVSAAIQGRNRVAVLHGIEDLRVEEREVPEPAPHEVLVEVRSVGVCGSDVHYFEHGRIGEHVVRAPMVLGHEASGVVVAAGEDARQHAVGQRVALEPGVPDLRCRACRTGHYNLCPNVRFFATPPIDGAFATYVTIVEDFAYAVPDSLSDDAAALIEPLSVGLWACRRAHVQPGDTVLITGAGPVGLLAVQAARAAGAAAVVVSDVNERRLTLALELGASATVDVREKSLGGLDLQADALLECSGSPQATRDGLSALRPAATAVLVGMGPDELAVPLGLVQQRELNLTGTFRYANTYPAAIALAASGQVDLDRLVTGHYGLDRAEEALRAARTDPTSVKAVVTPGSG